MGITQNEETSVTSQALFNEPQEQSATLPTQSTNRTFGETLRGIRERLGLTQPVFAKLLGKSTSYVSLLESNQRRPTERVLNNLKAAIKLTESEETNLTTAAAVPDPLAQLIQYAVSTLSARTGADDFQRFLLHEDLARIFHAYLGLLQGHQYLNANRFQQAHDQFERVMIGDDASALPALVRAAAGVALADVALKQGEPTSAGNAIAEARQLLDGALTTSALPLHAEAEAMQGMLDLYAGRYTEAVEHLTDSLTSYNNVMTTEPSEKAVAAIGLTKSYNRLALLALFKGDAASAQSYCKSALDALKVISPDEDDLSDPCRARLVALQAWACVQDGNFREARKLRQRACDAYEARHDNYGLAKTWLYMADDARLELQKAVELGDEALTSSSTRIETFRKRLNAPDMPELAQRSLALYKKACMELEHLGEALLLSRAYRGLGDMHRYVALASPGKSTSEFMLSRSDLHHARDLEQRGAQGRLLPETLESLARLEWDENHLAHARDYFTEAISSLATTKAQEDITASLQMRRYMLGLQQVKEALGASSNQNVSRVPLLQHWESSPIWRHLISRLAEAVAAAIDRNHAAPESTSSLTLGWTERLYDLDQRQGARIVAQSALSTSHELTPLQPKGLGRMGVEAESDLASALHRARFYATDLRIQEANEHPEAGSIYTDICVRQVVEDGVRRDDHACKRATESLRRLRDWGRGYRLLVVEEAMPIHFLLKGEEIALVELTYEAGEIDPRLRQLVEPDREVCIPFQDATLVASLRDIATEMQRIAEQQGHDAEWTIMWLESLVGASVEPEVDATAVPAL